jgi:ABC-type transport system substrate-binding protein
VAAEYTPSVGTVYKRHEGWYDPNILYVDEVRSPIVSQYATGLAQFIKGSIYRFLVNSNDIIQTKNDQPLLSLYQNEVGGGGPIFFFGWNPALGEKTPFRDQRLRQAFSLSWDRDLWIDVFFNVEKFRSQGFSVETAWNSALPSSNTGWWLDPRGKEFGANSKYYKHDPAEAKKLVAAAGFPNGLDIEAHYINSSNYGLDFQKRVEVILNMAAEAGLKTTYFPADFVTDWVPKYQDAKGDFPGISARNLASGNPDVGEKSIQVFTPEAGILYTGFFSPDSSFQKGDPKMTSLLMKTRAEFDQDKRVGLIKDFQRMAAETQYIVYVPGAASSFTLAWPVLRNQNILQGETVPYVHQWLDPAKPPLGKT